MKILYIEDNLMDADLLVRSFSRHAPEIDVDVARTYAEAVSKLERCTVQNPVYDLVLADINLPDGSGMSLVTFIRERRLPVAAVMLTGAGNDEMVVSALKAGASDYVVKRDDYLLRLPEILQKAELQYRTERERRSQPLHVLYAEDDLGYIDQIRGHFARYAPYIHLEVAQSAASVLHRLSGERRPDQVETSVLLLNRHLPDMNGLMLLKELRQVRGLDTPIVLITDHGDEETALQALKLGAMDYVVRNEGFLHKLPLILEDAFHRTEIARDQAKLKSSEEMYRQLVETLQEGILTVDELGKTTFVNSRMTEMLGYSADEMKGAHLDKFLDKDGAKAAELLMSMHQKGARESRDFKFLRKDGSHIFALIEASPVFDSKGRYAGAIAGVVDITERKLAEERLKDYSEHLQEMVEERTRQLKDIERLAAIGETAVMIGHDLRNPLQAIFTTTYLARSKAESCLHRYEPCSNAQGLLDDLKTIEDQSRYMNKIVSDLQDYARVLVPEMADVDILALVKNVISSIRVPGPIEVGIDIEEGKTWRVDPTMMTRVLTNLITNAIQAMPRGGRLRVASVMDDGDGVMTIEDSGTGISPDIMPRIFSPLFTTKAKGMGMGLVVSKRLLEAQGGEIRIISEPGMGTAVSIRMPY